MVPIYIGVLHWTRWPHRECPYMALNEPRAADACEPSMASRSLPTPHIVRSARQVVRVYARRA